MKREADTKHKILALMRGPKYRPLDQKELTRALGRKGDSQGAVVEALRELERSGEIARIRKNRYILPEAADLVTGKLHIHQAGFGFLAREGSCSSRPDARMKQLYLLSVAIYQNLSNQWSGWRRAAQRTALNNR